MAKNGGQLVEITTNIRQTNESNLDELQDIAASSEEQLASMSQLVSLLETIQKTSKEIVEMIQ